MDVHGQLWLGPIREIPRIFALKQKKCKKNKKVSSLDNFMTMTGRARRLRRAAILLLLDRFFVLFCKKKKKFNY